MRDIRDGDELEEFEAHLTFLRGLQLASDLIAGEYDLAHLQAFHRYLFAGLYEWAGELRTVVLAKTDLFCLPEHIESYGTEIFGKLAEEDRLRGSIANSSSIVSLTISATSTRYTRFATATGAPSAPSLPSWPPTRATAWTGSSSTHSAIPTFRWPRCKETRCPCETCWMKSPSQSVRSRRFRHSPPGVPESPTYRHISAHIRLEWSFRSGLRMPWKSPGFCDQISARLGGSHPGGRRFESA